MSEKKVLFEVNHVCKYFPTGGNTLSGSKEVVKAVDDVSFVVYEGETLGIVGESGSGKTTIGRTMIRLNDPTSGEILFEGRPIQDLTRKQMRPLRKEMQIIFQDPYSSLDPRMTVGQLIQEPLDIQGDLPLEERKARVHYFMEICGLEPHYINRYPHEFSGGQRQRIGIARSLALRPKFVVCDEAVSALDVSIQSQIMNLLIYLQEVENLTYVFISHNLNVVYHMSDRIMVMYHGKVVELADREELYFHPLHPYTKLLLRSIPNVEHEGIKERHVDYHVPLPDGYVLDDDQKACALHEVKPGHFVFCKKL
ncbi:ABC transporter ATP-binding protein [Allofustis seminis]|uniref:ABC transporter ATP-binding protein n=1 Tax=Allofustis seminis TaxID=166939 RepID=UPI000361CC3F|nr:ATP-binding cassette domain-containing protein [Allofustis seminis]